MSTNLLIKEMFIVKDKSYVMLITEVIPHSQTNPITEALLDVESYQCTLNFELEKENLGASGIRGVAIYSQKTLKASEVDFKIFVMTCGLIYQQQTSRWYFVSNTDSDNKHRGDTLCLTLIATHAWKAQNVTPTRSVMAISIIEKLIGRTTLSLQDSNIYYIKTLQGLYLFQQLTEPTRYWENQKSSILDLILSSEEGMVHHDLTYHPPICESDHACLVFNVFHTQRKHIPNTTTYTGRPAKWQLVQFAELGLLEPLWYFL